MKKKPHHKLHPTNYADILRIEKQAHLDAMKTSLYIALYVLIDKYNMPKDDVQKLAGEINYAADSIAKGYISWNDIRKVLEDEYDVHLELI